MDNSREARRSSSNTMATSNGVTKRRQRFSESSRGQVHQERKERDPEPVNRSKRRRSERFAPRDNSDESLGDDDVKHIRIHRHAVADGMIGVPVPRKARSACIKRSSHECRTSSGSGSGGLGEDRRRPPTSPGLEVASPTVSVKLKKNVIGPKSGIPKPPKSSGTMEEDLEIEIAEVLSGLKKQHPHSSKREEDDSTNGASSLVPNIHKEKEVTPSVLDGVLDKQCQDSAVSKGESEGPQVENNREETSKLGIDLMVSPIIPSSPERLSLLPLDSNSVVAKDSNKQDRSVKSKEKTIVEKRQCLNLDLERLSQETTSRDSTLRLQNFDQNQSQQAKSGQQSSVLPLTVALGGWPSGAPHQGYVPLTQKDKLVDSGSYTLVQGASFSAFQPRPKRCATHFLIARNIQLHQHFVKANQLPQPNKGSVYLKGGDLRPAAGNPSLVGNLPILSLNSQSQDGFAANISAPEDKASESGHFGSTRQEKLQVPPASNSILPAQAFIFPTNHHLQPVILSSKSSRPTNSNPCVDVGTSSVNFNYPRSSASEASSPYFTVLPNNAYSFQLSSTIRGSSQALPFFNGSFYSPQIFQPPQLLQKQSQAQRETKAGSSSSSSHWQPQTQVGVNSVSSQVNVQKHRQQSRKSEAKAAKDNPDSWGTHIQKGGPYAQIMTAPMLPHNFSMSFAGGSPPANLNFSSNGYQFVSAAPVFHQKNHQASDSKRGGGICSSHAEDPKKTLTGRPPAKNGQTLVFDKPSRTLNFVSGTWPPPAATTMNGDPSVFSHHLTQRQQQSDGSKMRTHSQADSVTATPSHWQKKNPATSSLTSCNALNLKKFQSQQQIRTHGQTQISFAAPSKSQQGRSGGGSSSSSAVTGPAPHGNASTSKVNNNKALPLSPVPSSATHAQDQAENSASGSTQKTSPVCGRNVPPIITSCPGHLSEPKY